MEIQYGSDPFNGNRTPENIALDQSYGLQTCSDGADNDADGLTDGGDPGCS